MACGDFADLLERSLEGGLDPKEQKLLDEHLETCAVCRFRLAALHDLSNLHEGEEVPEAFSAAWREQIKTARPRPVIRLPHAARWAAMAATLALLLFGAYKAGDLGLLGTKSMPADQDTAAYAAVENRKALPAQDALPEMMAGTVTELPEGEDAVFALDAAPMAVSATAQNAQESGTDDGESGFLSFLVSNLIYLMSLAALILLILLIHEKRKHK